MGVAMSGWHSFGHIFSLAFKPNRLEGGENNARTKAGGKLRQQQTALTEIRLTQGDERWL